MNRLPTLLTILFFAFGTLLIQAVPPQELTDLQQTYDRAVSDRVTAPFQVGVAVLNAKFISALDKATAEAKQAGNLDAVLALLDDKKTLEAKQPMPADTDATPDALKKLRAIYREQLAKLEAERSTNQGALLPAYLDKLKTLETTLTKADRIEDARAVRLKRETLAAAASTLPGPSAPTSFMLTPTVPSPASSSTLNAVTGDDHKAATWVLGVGGQIQVIDRGKEINVRELKDLPRSIKLTGINLNGEALKLAPISDDDIQILTGLQDLTSILLSKVYVSTNALRFLGTLPKLRHVVVKYMKVDGSFMQHLAPLKQLETVDVAYSNSISNIKFSALTSPVLGTVNLYLSSAGDETLSELAKHTGIADLNIANTKVTDAGLAALSGLKNLRHIRCMNSAITANGLSALSTQSVETLSFGHTGETIAAQLPDLGKQFTKVKTFQLPRGASIPADVLPALAAAFPQLDALHAYDIKYADPALTGIQAFAKLSLLDLKNSCTDDAVPNLAQLKSLKTLILGGTKLTDAGLSGLAKLRSLKELDVSGTQVTQAGIAAFQRSRPDVALTTK